MMKKAIKWLALFLGALLVVIVIGLAALPFIFPLDKIKDFATARLSEMIHREVKIEKVFFNIFSGIKLEGLSVSNRAGFAKQPFIKAASIDLSYAFWPLFSRQIIIKEISLVKPEILIEKNARGEFNFSDLTTQRPNNLSTQRPNNQTTKPPFDLFVTSFSIKGGNLSYADRAAGSMSQVSNLNFLVSGFELALVKPIDIRLSADLIYQGKTIPAALAGKIGLDLPGERVIIAPLSLNIAGESLSATAAVSGWKRAPSVEFSLNSKQISVDPLLAIFAVSSGAVKAKPKPGEITRNLNKALASIPANLTVKGNAKIDNLTFMNFKVDRIDLAAALVRKKLTADIKEVRFYAGRLTGKLSADLSVPGLSYSAQELKLSGFNSTPFINSVADTFLTTLPDYKDLQNKVYGTLSASLDLKGRGVEPQDIMAALGVNGSFSIKNGELKRVKTLAEVGKTLKSNTLQGDIKFGDLSTGFAYKSKTLNVKGFKFDNPDINLGFNGGLDLGKLAWIAGNRLNLKLSPAAVPNVPREFNLFKDERGWLELTFEITGSLKKPIPKPILEKPLEKAVGKLKVQIEAKKVEIEQKVNAELASQEAAAKKALEEQKAKAVEQLKEEAKNQLKQLFKP